MDYSSNHVSAFESSAHIFLGVVEMQIPFHRFTTYECFLAPIIVYRCCL
jgi:hypothetical protein